MTNTFPRPGRALLSFLLPAVVGLLLASPAGAAVVDPQLATATRSGAGPWQVIVTFHGSGAPTDAHLTILNEAGIARGVLLQALPIAGVIATSGQVAELANRPEVRSVWLNRRLRYDLDAATAATGVDRVRQDAGLTQRNGGIPVNGRGVTIMVNDSGVDAAHPDLSHVVANAMGHLNLNDVSNLLPVTYVEGVPNTDIGGGHGTHVLSIAGGTGAASGGAFEGVAPAADLAGFGSGATLAILNVLGGFDYALRNRERLGIRVVNNSWGDTADTGDFNPDDPVNVATKALNDQGVVIVFSAGNAGPNPGTISGNYKKAPWVICVASSNEQRVLANSSSRGVKDKTVVVTGSDGTVYVSEDRPTVTAPGVSILAARASGGTLTPALSFPPWYASASGTSMAAPHVAGIVALLLDANPSLTPAQVKAILEDTADLMSGYEAWEVGAGFVNAYDAVTAAFDAVAPVRTKKCNNRKKCVNGVVPRVTVAVIDSAINPYHEFFNAGGGPYAERPPSSVTPEVLAAFGIDESHILRLTRTGNFAADYAADAAIWNSIRPGELYWFAGTNIIAVSFVPGTRPILPDDAADTHGVGTSSAVLRANPDAIVLFVEGIDAAAETFTFAHPEVDIVTTSYGPIGSIPLPEHLTSSYTGVVRNGKLHFGAADNSPSTAMQDATAGPWWSIGIAGFEEGSSEGRQVLSGSFPDFVGDFYQEMPYCHDCESGLESHAGTSFATPRSAGTMSKILLEVRRALGHAGGIRDVGGTPVMAQGATRTITNWELRRALEEAAYYPAVVDYDPVQGVTDQSVPVLDPTPWTQVGWGAITPDPEHRVIDEALAQLGLRGAPTRFKDYGACLFQTTIIQSRHAYWDNLIVTSESWMQGYDPYIYCGP
ncbi:MAG TPA: S8 family serine peptidase [Thermoanaerobaculia bacterium]